MRYSPSAIVTAAAWLVAFSSLTGGVTSRASGATADGKIAVLPFAPLNPAEPRAWIGDSIRQALLADLVSVAPGRAEPLDARVNDQDGAISAGRKAGAAYAITGHFATAGDEVRVTADVLDVAAGRPVATAKATGTTGELFAIEAALARQVRHGLGLTAPLAVAEPAAGAQDQQPFAGEPAVANDFGVAGAGLGGGDFGAPGYGSSFGWGVGAPVGIYIGPVRPFRFCHRWASGWDGSHSAGLANSTRGVPLGAQGTISITSNGAGLINSAQGVPMVSNGTTSITSVGGGLPGVAVDPGQPIDPYFGGGLSFSTSRAGAGGRAGPTMHASRAAAPAHGFARAATAQHGGTSRR